MTFTNKYSNNKLLAWTMVFCGISLIIIWPIIQTMALRNLLLSIGGILGIPYLYQNRKTFFQSQASPLIFIILFFIWLGFHYFFFAQRPELELSELKGTWVRALLASILGLSIGLFGRDHSRVQHAIWLGISLFVVIFYLNYSLISIQIKNWSIPYPSQYGMYGNKISIIFYGVIALALTLGILSYKQTQSYAWEWPFIFGNFAFIGLIFMAFIVVGTKSGVVISILMISFYLVLFLLKRKKTLKSIIPIAIFIIFLVLASYTHFNKNTEWDNFSSSVSAGTQTEKYLNWRNMSHDHPPILEDGTVTQESAYLRTALAIVGFDFLVKNPYGYGLVKDSFKYIAQDSYPKDTKMDIIATLSGWLDFALGLGLPGLFLIWTAIALTIYHAIGRKNIWSHCTIWILTSIFFVWMVSEVTENHFIETIFYLISLLLAGNLPIISDKSVAEARS